MMLSGFWRDVGGVRALVSVNVLREPGGGLLPLLEGPSFEPDGPHSELFAAQWEIRHQAGFKPGKEVFVVLLSRGQAVSVCLGFSWGRKHA